MRPKRSISNKATAIRSLKPKEWAEADQQAWSATCENGGRLRRGGLAAHLKAVTRDDLARRYGQFLDFVQRHEGSLPAGATSSVTMSRVEAYVAELIARVSSVTVHGSIAKLRRISQLLSPEKDFSWLKELENHLAFQMRPSSKFDRIVDSQNIVIAGLKLMARAESSETLNMLRRGELYRNGLMIALLAACPIRIKNFSALSIDGNLIRVGDTWYISLTASETKERRPDERPVPDFLVSNLNRYLDAYRPIFKTTGNALWVGRYHSPMKIGSVSRVITETTRRHLGKELSPHLFRACAASTAYLNASAMPHLASALLNHRDPRTTEEHYNRSTSLAFSRKFNELLSRT
jgi:integrase